MRARHIAIYSSTTQLKHYCWPGDFFYSMGLDSVAFALLHGDDFAQNAKDTIRRQLYCYKATRVKGGKYDAQRSHNTSISGGA